MHALKTRLTYLLILVIMVASPVASGGIALGAGYCPGPKILMTSGVDIRTQSNSASARYWGKTVGVQGFLVALLMDKWQRDVGSNASSPLWRLAKRFQELYASDGVTDNYIKVSIHEPEEWRSSADNAAVVRNFANVASLARYAGFRGVALDLEPYAPIWGGGNNNSSLKGVVFNEGKAVGLSMRRAYPGMTLIVMRDVLYYGRQHIRTRGGYSPLAVPFLKGLLSVRFHRVVVAVERTYNGQDISRILPFTEDEYRHFIAANHLPQNDISIAPGLWPLGNSRSDAAARMKPQEFRNYLVAAFGAAPAYVWIYADGSAWQTGGSFGRQQRVVSNFSAYTGILKSIEKMNCRMQSSGSVGHGA